MKRLSWCAAVIGALAMTGGAAPAQDAPDAAELFESLDANSDGTVTSDEVSEPQKRFFERLLRAGDADEDGKLTREEFSAGTKSDERPATLPAGRGQGMRRGAQRPNPEQIFDRLDRDGDGKVALDDVPEQFRDRLRPIFERGEEDVLDREQFVKLAATLGPPQGGPGRGNPAEFLRRLDRNGDGKVTRDELPEPAAERLGRLFDQLGTDEIEIEKLTEYIGRMQRGGERDGDRRRAGADEERRDGERPRGRRDDGERPDRERPPQRPGRDGFRGPAIFSAIDANGDGVLSMKEIDEAAGRLKKLDANDDGEIDVREAMSPGGRPEGMEGRGPQFGRFQGRERDGERPRPEGDRPPRGGDRPRPDGDRPPREGDRPRPEGDRPPRGEMGRRGPGGPGGFRGPAFSEMIDRNGNGTLSRDELRDAVDKFSELDRDGDGELAPPELMGFPGRPGEGGRPPFGDRGRGRPPFEEGRPGDRPDRPEGARPPRDGERRRPGGDQDFLSRFDKDGDGQLSKDEAPGRLADNWDRFDKNEDGKLSQEEIRAVFGEGRGRPGRGRGEGERSEGDRPRRPESE